MPFTIAFFGVTFLSGAVYLLLGTGGPYLLPLLALLLVLSLGVSLGLLPQVLSGRARGVQGGDEGARAPASWSHTVRVMRFDVLVALVSEWLASSAGFPGVVSLALGLVSLALGVANVAVLAAYAVASWRERRALPWDRFGSWYFLAIVSCLIVAAGLMWAIKFS